MLVHWFGHWFVAVRHWRGIGWFMAGEASKYWLDK
jgi:hypothetical protein